MFRNCNWFFSSAKNRLKAREKKTCFFDKGVTTFMSIEPCPHRNRDYGIGSNFWKFYLIRTNFILIELVSLVKVFRVFGLKWILLVFRVWT